MRASCLLTALLAGCLPTSELVRMHDQTIKTREISSAMQAPVYSIGVAPGGAALALTAEQAVSCTREARRTVHRVKETEVSTNHGLHAIVYVLGLVGMGVGAGLIYTNASAKTSTDPTMIDSDIESETAKIEGIALGAGVAAVGTALVLVATGSSLNALDRESDLGLVEVPVEGSRKVVVCDKGPAAGVTFGLVVAVPGARSVYVPLGAADAHGRVEAAWADVVKALPPHAANSAGVVAGERPDVETQLANGVTPPLLAIVALPDRDDPEKAWSAALAANTAEAYRAFRTKYPESPHAAEAITHAREATTRTALAAFEAAMTGGDLEGAEKALATLRAEGDPAIAMQIGARFDAATRTERLARVRRDLAPAIAAIATAPDPAMAVANARSLVEELRALATDDAVLAELVTAQAQLADARGKLTAQLEKDGAAAFARQDFTAGNAKFEVAMLVTSDTGAVAHAREVAVSAALGKRHADARRLAAQKNYNDALDLLDELLALAPDDPDMTAEHAKWDAAAKAQEAAERAKMEREMKK